MPVDNYRLERQARHPEGWERMRGTVLMEFALIFPLLLVLTLAVVDVGRAFWVKSVTNQGAREGARTAVVVGLADTTDIKLAVHRVTDTANLTLVKCIPSNVGTSADPKWNVTIQTQFNWLYPGLFNWLGNKFTNPVTLTGSATMYPEAS